MPLDAPHRKIPYNSPQNIPGHHVLTYKHSAFLLCLLAGSHSLPLTAQGQAELCHQHAGLQPKPLRQLPQDKLVLESDQSQSQQNLYEFNGNVLLQYQNQLLQADQANYDDKQHRLQAQGNIHFQVPGLIAIGDAAELELDQHQGSVSQAQYQLTQSGGRGHAEEISVKNETAALRQASYTTCEGDRPAWQITASSITLDRDNNEGVARNVVLEVADIPVFYVPWASFALEGRKSGFLAPALGYSDHEGIDLTLPYYLNLAPNHDATLFPRMIEQRGAQLGGEYRYLNAHSAGQVYGEYLQNDQLYRQDRSLFTFKHQGQPAQHWRYSTRIEHVSDQDYFHDLGSNLGNSNQTQLERNVRTQIDGKNWSASALLQDYQVLTRGTAEPHRRLPQLQYRHRWQQPWVQSTLFSEYSYFHHDTLSNGQRLVVEPVFTTGFNHPGSYFQPRLRLRHTQYQLQDQGTLDGTNSVASLDTGLRLIRHGERVDQTLEPRLFFLYSPYRDQSQQPNFDTGALDLSFAQLFRDYRYAGGDRVGDEQRLTSGLTTRWINQSDGRQLLRLSVAHASYHSDHRIVLAGESPTAANDERLAAEIASEFLPGWNISSSLFQRADAQRPDKLAAGLNYEGEHHGLDLSGRYRQNLLKQVGASGYFSIGPQWQLAAKWIYSLQHERSNESVIGVQYASCCWRLRAIAQEFVSNAQGEMDRSIGLEIELSGLATVGRKTESRLSREIMGYRSEGF